MRVLFPRRRKKKYKCSSDKLIQSEYDLDLTHELPSKSEDERNKCFSRNNLRTQPGPSRFSKHSIMSEDFTVSLLISWQSPCSQTYFMSEVVCMTYVSNFPLIWTCLSRHTALSVRGFSGWVTAAQEHHIIQTFYSSDSIIDFFKKTK